MTIKGVAYIVGTFEHPTRKSPDKSAALLHAECALGALAAADLSKDDVEGCFSPVPDRLQIRLSSEASQLRVHLLGDAALQTWDEDTQASPLGALWPRYSASVIAAS